MYISSTGPVNTIKSKLNLNKLFPLRNTKFQTNTCVLKILFALDFTYTDLIFVDDQAEKSEDTKEDMEARSSLLNLSSVTILRKEY